jgi:hypothetical protein
MSNGKRVRVHWQTRTSCTLMVSVENSRVKMTLLYSNKGPWCHGTSIGRIRRYTLVYTKLDNHVAVRTKLRSFICIFDNMVNK